MIVPCGPGPLDSMNCFESGYDYPAGATAPSAITPVAAAAPVPATPVGFSLWNGRNDAIGMDAAATLRAAALAAPAYPKVDMRTGSSRALAAYAKSPNPFTQCLYREQAMWDRIVSQGGLTRLCCPSMPGKGDPPPWVAMPGDGRRYQQIGSIVLPAVANTDTLVTTFAVPTGYDGVIVSIVNMFTGAGFVEGSGDLHYRIQINRRWLKDYGDIQTTMGTVASPCMIYRGGVKLRTQEVVRYWVSVTAAGLGVLDPTGRIVCAFFGWFYPQV